MPVSSRGERRFGALKGRIAIDARFDEPLPGAALLAQAFEAILAEPGFAEPAIGVRHARIAGEIDIAHKDPFDRLLIAQTQAEDMVLVSSEALFDGYAVKRLW